MFKTNNQANTTLNKELIINQIELSYNKTTPY